MTRRVTAAANAKMRTAAQANQPDYQQVMRYEPSVLTKDTPANPIFAPQHIDRVAPSRCGKQGGGLHPETTGPAENGLAGTQYVRHALADKAQADVAVGGRVAGGRCG